MKATAIARVLSIVLGALVLGLLIGYQVRASGEKKAGKGSSAPVSVPCGQVHTIYVFADGFSEIVAAPGTKPPPAPPTSAGDDHAPTSVCDKDSITWQIAPSASQVSGFEIYFDESPCETSGNFPPALHPSSSGTYTCNVNAKVKTGQYVHKYELIINVGNTNRYHDPIVIVSGTGNLQ